MASWRDSRRRRADRSDGRPLATAPAVRGRPLQRHRSRRQPVPTAGLGLSTIEVIVSRNDTLDRIFRRLKLNLADLASLRDLPGLHGAARPAASRARRLRLMHRDGALFGFERQLSPSETLQVMRESIGLSRRRARESRWKRDVRTVRGVIDSSLFEAVTAAGAHDQTALALARSSAGTSTSCSTSSRGDSFIVTYEEISQDGEYIKDGPILAASFVNQGREYRAVRYVDPERPRALLLARRPQRVPRVPARAGAVLPHQLRASTRAGATRC